MQSSGPAASSVGGALAAAMAKAAERQKGR